MFGVTDQDEFAALTGKQEDTLADRPNHLFVHPRIFAKANGPRTSRRKALAYAIMEQLSLELADLTTDREKAEVKDEMDNLEVLLAFLWASEQGLLTLVTLSDMEESPQLFNHQCELILGKNRKLDTPQTELALDPAGALAMATQSLMLSMQQRESTRLLERAEDKNAKSLIRNLSPNCLLSIYSIETLGWLLDFMSQLQKVLQTYSGSMRHAYFLFVQPFKNSITIERMVLCLAPASSNSRPFKPMHVASWLIPNHGLSSPLKLLWVLKSKPWLKMHKFAPLLEDEVLQGHHIRSCEPVLDRKNGKVLDRTHTVDNHKFLFCLFVSLGKILNLRYQFSKVGGA